MVHFSSLGNRELADKSVFGVVSPERSGELGEEMLEKKSKFTLLLTGSLSLFTAVSATTALAGYTPIAPPYEGEQSTSQILNHTYGESFVKVGRDYVGVNYTAYRVQDTVTSGASVVATPSVPMALDMGSGLPSLAGDSTSSEGSVGVSATDPTDQLWSGNAVIAVAHARFAMYDQNFGYFNGTSSSVYHSLLSVTGTEYDVSGSGFMTGLDGRDFRFARKGDNATFSSQNADNPLSIDHMITYQIVYHGDNAQAANSKVYMLFWDDKLPTDNSDYDYNDMAIEILVTNSTPAPEPVSAGVLAIGSTLLLRRKRD